MLEIFPRRFGVHSIASAGPSRPPEFHRVIGAALAARGKSRTEPLGAGSGRMQGAAKRRILEVFKRAATQQPAQNLPERRRGDFHHGLLGVTTLTTRLRCFL
jgi:hypothetical protein